MKYTQRIIVCIFHPWHSLKTNKNSLTSSVLILNFASPHIRVCVRPRFFIVNNTHHSQFAQCRWITTNCLSHCAFASQANMFFFSFFFFFIALLHFHSARRWSLLPCASFSFHSIPISTRCGVSFMRTKPPFRWRCTPNPERSIQLVFNRKFPSPLESLILRICNASARVCVCVSQTTISCHVM